MNIKKAIVVAMVAIASLAALSVAGIFAIGIAAQRELTGKWPFKPLETIASQIALSNGAYIHIKAVEQRGFRSDGWSVYASYKPDATQPLEQIGGWEGYDHIPSAYVVKDIVVLPSPDKQTIYVRTAEGKWKFFSMQFPDEHTSMSESFYTAMTSLSKEEILSIRKDIEPDEKDWSPAVYVESFDPATMEFLVSYRTNLKTVRHLRLHLSTDGTQLRLIEVRREICS